MTRHIIAGEAFHSQESESPEPMDGGWVDTQNPVISLGFKSSLADSRKGGTIVVYESIKPFIHT